MSDGKTHEFYSRWGLVGVTATTLILNKVYDYPTEIYWAIGGGLLAYFIDSDQMDMHQISTRGEHRLYKIFKPLGFVVECWSYPLAKLLPHRSIYSHLPGLCSIIRLLYYVLPVVYLVYGYEQTLMFIQNNFAAILFLFLGSVCIDCIHATCDKWRFIW